MHHTGLNFIVLIFVEYVVKKQFSFCQINMNPTMKVYLIVWMYLFWVLRTIMFCLFICKSTTHCWILVNFYDLKANILRSNCTFKFVKSCSYSLKKTRLGFLIFFFFLRFLSRNNIRLTKKNLFNMETVKFWVVLRL